MYHVLLASRICSFAWNPKWMTHGGWDCQAHHVIARWNMYCSFKIKRHLTLIILEVLIALKIWYNVGLASLLCETSILEGASFITCIWIYVSAQMGNSLNFAVLHIHAIWTIACSCVHEWRTTRNMQHLYLYDSVTRLYGTYMYVILDEATMNKILTSLSHPCIYGRVNIRILKRVIELRLRPLLA